ncbi:hypothetical protein O0L34_g12352 [Tuta absoluta]|nr:hypothetical protein O0L34_g12352 [Tuta absoluta]
MLPTRNVVIATPTPPSPAPQTPPPQKFVIVSQQKAPQIQAASGQGHIVVHSSQPTIVRSQNVQSVVVTSGPAGANAGGGGGAGPAPQKVVVVGMPPTQAAQAVQGVSQAPVTVVAKPVFSRGGPAQQPPPPELDDLSHLA